MRQIGDSEAVEKAADGEIEASLARFPAVWGRIHRVSGYLGLVFMKRIYVSVVLWPCPAGYRFLCGGLLKQCPPGITGMRSPWRGT